MRRLANEGFYELVREDFEQATGQKVLTGDNFLPASKKSKQLKKKKN